MQATELSRLLVTDLSTLVAATPDAAELPRASREFFRRDHVHTIERDGFSNEVYHFDPCVGTHLVLRSMVSESELATPDVTVHAAITLLVSRSTLDGFTEWDAQVTTKGQLCRLRIPSRLITCEEGRENSQLEGHVLVAPLKIPGLIETPCRVAQIVRLDGGKLLNMEVLEDCTQVLDESSSFYPGGQQLVRCPAAGSMSITMGCDVGTHVDSPSHFFADGRRVSDFALSELVAPGWVIDVRPAAADNADYVLTVDDILKSERSAGRQIVPKSIVAVCTGFGKLFGSPSYSNVLSSDDGPLHFPGISLEAAEFLLNERLISGLGIDTLSIDCGVATSFPVHQLLLGNDCFQVENMKLDALADRWARSRCSSFFFAVLPWAIEGAYECVARVVALAAE